MRRQHFVSKPAETRRCSRCRIGLQIALVDGLTERLQEFGPVYVVDNAGRYIERIGWIRHQCGPDIVVTR